MKHQYYCSNCGYHREGLLDAPAVGIGSYSTLCPRCQVSYSSYPVDKNGRAIDEVCSLEDALKFAEKRKHG